MTRSKYTTFDCGINLNTIAQVSCSRGTPDFDETLLYVGDMNPVCIRQIRDLAVTSSGVVVGLLEFRFILV